ncbi:MAG: photosynthetic reaction center cytochrome PufC [Alkalilacustris sp.]
MFPKWYDKWNKDNPTNILGPAILVGAAGGAIFIGAAWWAVWQGPYNQESMQTGPAGTGMHVARFTSDLARQDPTIERYVTFPPVVPTEDSVRAGDVVENIEPLLADLTVENYERLLEAMRSWTGIEDLLEPGLENYQTTVARSMIQMTQELNEFWGAHVNQNVGERNVGVSCFTCHRGEPVPTHTWHKLGDVNMAAAGWSANQNRVTVQSQFTSLPSDALEKYLLEANPINVHDLEPRVSREMRNPATWQDTERTFSLMNYISNSLGVNCTFCHNTRAFYDPAQHTPQWTIANLGIIMVQEINNDWLVPLTDVLPEHRLGPIFGDVGKVACATCHKGYQQPMHRLDMISDWPELATTGEPFYE